MQTVLITGASMGIGRALALAWAKQGATVVLSARGREALDAVAANVEAAGGRALALPGDVTDDGYRRELVERAVAAGGGLDVLVNNAGRGFYGPVLDIEPELLRELFELNVIAPLRLSQLCAPHLGRARGAVVMMSSVAGVVAAPRYAAYAASKFALEGLSMAMRAEFAARGVAVVVVRPGPVKTAFRAHAIATGDGEAIKKSRARRPQTPEAVAALTLDAVAHRRPVVETSAFVRVASAAVRLAPGPLRVVFRKMAR